jgi:hypothetical protein
VRRVAAAFLALLLLLAGCSGRVFFYNRLDLLIPWYLGRYVELEREQDRYLDQLLEPFLSWHRQQELPRYLALLEEAEAALEGPVTAAEIAGLSDAAEAAWYRLRDAAVDWLLDLGGELSALQVAEFIAALRERQEEYEEEYLPRSDETFREEACESMVDSLRDYLGRLEPAQEERLCAAAQDLERSDRLWLAERAAWIAILEHELRREPGWEERLRALIGNWSAQVSAEYLRMVEHNSAVVEAAIADAIDRRTPRQDARLRRELADLREDLQTLLDAG